jgi:hypothetical protein
MDLVMMCPPGILAGAFVVSPDPTWHTRVFLPFSLTVALGAWSKSYDCALVSTLENYDDPQNGTYLSDLNYFDCCGYCKH